MEFSWASLPNMTEGEEGRRREEEDGGGREGEEGSLSESRGIGWCWVWKKEKDINI